MLGCTPLAAACVAASTPRSLGRIKQEHSIIRTLFDHGLQRLHVRKPGWSEEAIERYVDRVDSYRDRIVIHSTPQLAARLGVKGVHYTERTRPLPPLTAAANAAAAGSTVSTSFHSLQQLRTDWGPALSYAFLSPIFDSISKEGYSAARFDRRELRHVLQCPFPVVALGGITPENIQDTEHMGFAGAAVIGSVWQAKDPTAAWERLHQAAQDAWGPHTPC